MIELHEQERYDLDLSNFQGLGLGTWRELTRLGAKWQAANSHLRAQRLADEAAGPKELK
jgi:hypothetical protein